MVKKMHTVVRFDECLPTEDDDDNFLEDPALFYDDLPQPYRRINKILLEIFNDAWEEIAKWEAARVKDASRIRPPLYDCASQLQGYSDASCLACSPDGLHVIVGLSSGLAVLSGPSQQMEANWREDGMDILQLDLKQMSNDVLLINSQDVQGVIRLFAYTKMMLFPLYIFGEGAPEDSMQKMAVKSEMSLSADFIGIFMQDKSSSQQTGWLEVYRLPRDTWLKEIEATVGKINADKESSAKAEVGEMLEEGISSESTGEINETTCGPVEAEARVPSASYQRISATQKFSLPALILKLQHLNKVPSMSWSSPYQASRVAGNDGEVIGTGNNHIVSAHHLSNRMAMFKHQHQQYLRYLPTGYSSSSTTAQILPTFHFLLPGKLSSHDQSSAGQPNAIAVWWSGERHLMQYSLTKTSKDLKPDSVWSLSSAVVSSAVTECNCTMALALSNNSVVIWNRFMGLPYKTLHWDDPGQVSWMMFTTSVLTSEVKDLGTEVTGSSGLHLLVQCTTGAMYTVPCTWGQDPAPALVSTEICNSDEIPSSIEPIRGTSPQLMLIARQDGRIFLHDICEKALLCEVALPKCYMLHRALDHPSVVTASAGRMLYAIGTRTVTEETGEDRVTSVVRSLFAVKMWLFPHLDNYQPSANNKPIYQPCCQKMTQNNLEVHTSKILQNRIDEQTSRKTRLQSRWYKMKEELSHTLELMAGN